ncbi:MAG: WD40 repeat domain-containing protein, partial [Gloeotrichia echinulata HAB0833]
AVCATGTGNRRTAKGYRIWNLQTGELKSTLTGHSSLVLSVAISPDGQTLVSGSRDGTIKIWRMP